MKDVYDVWLLARQFAFDGAALAKVHRRHLRNRETPSTPRVERARLVAGTKNARSQI